MKESLGPESSMSHNSWLKVNYSAYIMKGEVVSMGLQYSKDIIAEDVVVFMVLFHQITKRMRSIF